MFALPFPPPPPPPRRRMVATLRWPWQYPRLATRRADVVPMFVELVAVARHRVRSVLECAPRRWPVVVENFDALLLDHHHHDEDVWP